MKIKKGLKKEFKEYCKINKDPYSKAVIDCVEKVGKLLDEGFDCEKAMFSGIKGLGITGFQAGCLALTIVHFHLRGEEFQVWWNKFNGSSEEEARNGVINPALLTLKTKGEK